jgi:hypothetical protein
MGPQLKYMGLDPQSPAGLVLPASTGTCTSPTTPHITSRLQLLFFLVFIVETPVSILFCFLPQASNIEIHLPNPRCLVKMP